MSKLYNAFMFVGLVGHFWFAWVLTTYAPAWVCVTSAVMWVFVCLGLFAYRDCKNQLPELIELMRYPGNGGTAVFFVLFIILAAMGIVVAIIEW